MRIEENTKTANELITRERHYQNQKESNNKQTTHVVVIIHTIGIGRWGCLHPTTRHTRRRRRYYRFSYFSFPS